jgi:hypothetical protein
MEKVCLTKGDLKTETKGGMIKFMTQQNSITSGMTHYEIIVLVHNTNLFLVNEEDIAL